VKDCIAYTSSDQVTAPKDLEIMYACGLIEIVHNGSLMCDDLEDKSLKRRGDLCTYLKFGEDIAVNAGTLMYFSPILKLNHFVGCPWTRMALIQIYGEEMNNIHFGQNWDICWHNG
jgi:geranylgeranyl pyrophosphate synthase